MLDDPALMQDGRDPQIDRAIEVLLKARRRAGDPGGPAGRS
ncbi:MAG: hypothetical protein R3E96_14620 [Planctomycetota bacterium]